MILVSPISPLSSALKVRLSHLELLGDFVVLLVRLLGFRTDVLQVVLQLRHSLLIPSSFALKHFPHSVAVVCGSRSLVKFLCGKQELVLANLKISLEVLHSPVEGVDLHLGGQQGFLLVVQLLGGRRQLLLCLVKLNLELLRLFDEICHLLLGLGSSHLCILGCLLTDVRPVHGVVLLHLHGLHLLLDSVHAASALLSSAVERSHTEQRKRWVPLSVDFAELRRAEAAWTLSRRRCRP